MFPATIVLCLELCVHIAEKNGESNTYNRNHTLALRTCHVRFCSAHTPRRKVDTLIVYRERRAEGLKSVLLCWDWRTCGMRPVSVGGLTPGLQIILLGRKKGRHPIRAEVPAACAPLVRRRPLTIVLCDGEMERRGSAPTTAWTRQVPLRRSSPPSRGRRRESD